MQKNGIKVNEEIIIIAALFHDAGYEEVKENKEQHSCKIMESELKKLNYSIKEINEVKNTIMATEKDYKLTTSEQKILRASDLSGFMFSYQEFKVSSDRIREEFKVLYPGKKFPIKKWTELVESYLIPEIRLTQNYEQDNFHGKAKENIQRFLKENKDNLI